MISMMRRVVTIGTIAGGIVVLLAAFALSIPSSSPVSALHDLPCADADGDGTTSAIDGRIVASWFPNSVPPAPAAADVNGDTVVDLLGDIFYVASRGGEFEQTWGGAAYIPCQDLIPAPFSGGPPAPGTTYVDTDGDGCSDVAEGGPMVGLGGGRDYLDPWDFSDTNGDKIVDLFADIFGVINLFGADADALVPPMGAGLNPEPDGYATRFDRSGGATIPMVGPPDGGPIDLTDIFTVANQFGHDCT